MSKTIVIGGWGVTPDILGDVFGDSARFVDSNSIVPSIINNTMLNTNWVAIILQELLLNTTDTYDLAGWSTGAIWALACAPQLNLRSLTLISPTLSFCRRNGYRYGMRSSVLSSMRTALTDTRSVLSQFYISCGIKTPLPSKIPWTQTELASGLHFLEQVDCTDLQFSYPEACIIHGAQDSIIPVDAGQIVANTIGTKVHLVNGKHAFFTNAKEETKLLIDRSNRKDDE